MCVRRLTFPDFQRFGIPHALIIAAFLLFGSKPAWAHKVNVFAYVEGDEVIVEGYFPDGRACQDSTIEVFDKQGKKILEGKTDAGGRFTFQPPTHTDMLVRLSSSMGHQAEYKISAAELSSTKPSAEAAASSLQAGAASPAGPASSAAGSPQAGSATDSAALEQMVERAVARQVLPLRRSIEEERDRRHLLDVIGGIGYLIGVMGIIAYLRAKRQRRTDE